MNTNTTITRRAFHRGALAAGAALLAAARPSRGASASTFPPGKYVDIHTHLGQEWGVKQPLTADLLLAWMDEHDIAQAVVLPLINPESWDHPLTTDYVLDQTKPHRDRLIPFCSVDPRTINLSAQGKRDLLRKYQDAGCQGFGEHKPGVPMDDPRNLDLFNACAEIGFPVLFHLDNSRNTDAPGLPGVEAVLKVIPEGVFIGHATGWWASISGGLEQGELQGYPKGDVAPGGAVGRLFDTYPNIYGDLSAGSGSNALARDPEHGKAFCLKYADRLLFGTDYLEPGQAVRQFEILDSFELPEDVQAKIYRDNARKLLGMH
ncbi:MAG: amidohydrolase family protein [Candidatus Hydrogenedentes bacterium]|nr:amidohydrolase family protein [Candidatus Hydrogenedentota bacterium]